MIDLGVESGASTHSLLVASWSAPARPKTSTWHGDTVDVTFPESGGQTMRVAGTFSKGSLINASYIMSMPDFAANVTSRLDGAILMTSTPGHRPGGGQGGDRDRPGRLPQRHGQHPADITQKAQDSVNQLLGIVTAMLLLAVIVAILGIVNTLVLSVVERTRELGLLRAVGARVGRSGPSYDASRC